MKIFNRDTLLKSLAIIVSSAFVLSIAHFIGSCLNVTPHVAMTYIITGVLTANFVVGLYNKVVLKKADQQVYKLVNTQGKQLSKLKHEVKELQKVIGTQKEPFKKRDKR